MLLLFLHLHRSVFVLALYVQYCNTSSSLAWALALALSGGRSDAGREPLEKKRGEGGTKVQAVQLQVQ